MSQPQRATFPSSGNHVWKAPAKCNPMLAYLGDVVGWLANQRLGDCNCRLIPERPPCQLKCFSPLDLLSEIAVISHVELDPKLEKGRRHFLPLSQTKAKRLRWRPLHKASCGLIVHCVAGKSRRWPLLHPRTENALKK
jgi:hypothetical protein